MASKYTGLSGDFAAQITAFAAQATEAIDSTCREIVIEIGSSVIRMSPVGNPETWKVNKISREYNKAVADHNDNLRKNPQNFDKRGYLKRGVKLNDGMGILAPEGYVGGRFRGNWMFGIGAPNNTTTEEIDPSGSKSTARIENGVLEFHAGDVAYITNSLPYAIPLEFGHSTQSPSGMVRVTIARFQQIVEAAIRNHQV